MGALSVCLSLIKKKYIMTSDFLLVCLYDLAQDALTMMILCKIYTVVSPQILHVSVLCIWNFLTSDLCVPDSF